MSRLVTHLTMKVLASGAALLATLAAHPGTAAAQPKPARSLCRAPETVLFTCDVGTKVVSICGQEQSGAVYRFGRPGHVELEATDLHRAERGESGGGDDQVYADTPTHRYIIYPQFVRTGFGDDGLHYPKFTSGLLVQSGGRTVLSRECTLPVTFDPITRTLVPEGEYVPH